jgi:hypothetical protein
MMKSTHRPHIPIISHFYEHGDSVKELDCVFTRWGFSSLLFSATVVFDFLFMVLLVHHSFREYVSVFCYRCLSFSFCSPKFWLMLIRLLGHPKYLLIIL